MKKYKYLLILSIGFFLSTNLWGQEKVANMTLQFEKVDTNNVCKVIVTSENKPVAEVAVKLFVQRLFGLLPVGGEVTTDETGTASFDFPNSIPLNSEGKLIVFAKVEDDENYGSFETKGETNIGVKQDLSKFKHFERSLAGPRGNAPIYFILTSLLIIAGIWGTLIYVVLQGFKIKSSVQPQKK